MVPQPHATLEQRIQNAAYGSIGALPRGLRNRPGFQYDARALSRLTTAMSAWSGAARLDPASFSYKSFGRSADDPMVARLRLAAQFADGASGHGDLRQAAIVLAMGMQAAGPDRWPGVLKDAAQRAAESQTPGAAAAGGPRPDGSGDRIRPVYPLEALIGILSGEGALRMLGAAGGVLFRRVVPDRPLDIPVRPIGESHPLSEMPILRGQQDKHIRGTNNFIEGRSELTTDPQALLREFGRKGSKRGNIPVGEPGSKEAFDTGDRTIGIYRNQDGRSALTTRYMIIYGKKGVHIYPATPDGWIE